MKTHEIVLGVVLGVALVMGIVFLVPYNLVGPVIVLIVIAVIIYHGIKEREETAAKKEEAI
jgi:hypothetical protein